MKIQSPSINQYKEISRLNPEQKNNISDKVYEKKEETKSNINDIKNQKNDFKADLYTYKTKQNQLDIYTEIASSNNDNKNINKETNINIKVEIENKNAGLVDKEPYKKINEFA